MKIFKRVISYLAACLVYGLIYLNYWQISEWININLGKLYCVVSVYKINSTKALMKKIYVRYYGKWYEKVAFSQTTDSYENDSLVKSEIWHKDYWGPVPDKESRSRSLNQDYLTIYFTPPDISNYYICRDDSVFLYENGRLTSAEKSSLDAIILSMDIYNMTYREIMKQWKKLPYDTKKFHKTTRDGKNYYVIGASEGDTMSNQVWFDAERFLVAKIQKQTPQGMKEVDFRDHRQLPDGKGWIEQEVESRLNGKVYMREKYFNFITEEDFSMRHYLRRRTTQETESSEP